MVTAESIREISSGVWIWHAYDESVRTELYSTAVAAEFGLVIIDPIDLVHDAFHQLAKHAPAAAIVLTNGNHSRAAVRFRERFGAPVFAHNDAVGELTTFVDGALRPGRPVAGSLEVLQLPGAGLGEIALFHRKAKGECHLHFGDALVNLDPHGLIVLPEKYCLSASLLAESLQSLPHEDLSLVTFAHGEPLLAPATEKIRSLVGQLSLPKNSLTH
ncbi:MAG: hypothetical protein ORN83_10060 [Chthoniobacteraceae bacterium]|nr:hypothetical protein [Chthoniobacteraceae bacterium]